MQFCEDCEGFEQLCFLHRSAIGFPSFGIWHSAWPSFLVWRGIHWFSADNMAVYSTNRTTDTLVPGPVPPRNTHLCESWPASYWPCIAYRKSEVGTFTKAVLFEEYLNDRFTMECEYWKIVHTIHLILWQKNKRFLSERSVACLVIQACKLWPLIELSTTHHTKGFCVFHFGVPGEA